MTKHEWKYASLGGSPRIVISSGADIASLKELDQKKWTVLSCPTSDLGNLDAKTVAILDEDGDGRIRAMEVIKAAGFMAEVLKDDDLMLTGADALPLSEIDDATDKGRIVLTSAKRMLSNLGTPEKSEISVADTIDSAALFAKSRFNGDGIITSATSEELGELVGKVGACCGTVTDRSGEQGIDADKVEAFYAACADYDAWSAAGEKNPDTRPYGDGTSAACAAVDAVSAKIDDYFVRCKLIAFDPATADAVDVPVEKLAAIGSENLSEKSSEISIYPIARPTAEVALPYDAINPAWQEAFATFKASVLDKDFPEAKSLDEKGWAEVKSKLAPYRAWMGEKKGAQVEQLGLADVRAILKADKKQSLLSLIGEDKAMAGEYDGMETVAKALLLLRDFHSFLRSYVVFSDFYNRAKGTRGLFEAGKLYIDQRCCDLCIKVNDMSKHADMAKLSGMFLIYCKCTSKDGNAMDIVAVMTDGDTADLRPGKNGIFYDNEGKDWDATVTNIVDNPISVAQAFWSPYRKFRDFCVGLVNKSAADKESKMTANLQTAAQSATAAPAAAAAGTAQANAKKPGFNIAEFAGIFAAIGMAIGYIGSFFVSLAKGVSSTPWWEILMIIAAIMLLISGPSCFIAWTKLRRRNLGPVLNANGWAINSKVLVGIPFGRLLTSVAKYPKVPVTDPVSGKAKGSSRWKVLLGIAIILAVALLIIYANLYFNFV